MDDTAARRHHDRRTRALPRDVRPHALVAGVDGCRGGWAVALADDEKILEVRVMPHFANVLALDLDAIAVDMPIGLLDAGPRACDIEARRRLGPRRASVFPAPRRPMLAATSYSAALALGGVSKQAFNLIPKIREVDTLMSPALQARVVEAHPELCFARLAGGPCQAPKRTVEGREERMAVVQPNVVAPPRGAAWDDVLDACALVETARRLRDVAVERLGDGTKDAKGLRCEIVL